MVFKKALKEQAKLRLALSGPSGSGKTYTALTFAKEFGKRIAVIDTEGKSSAKYANIFDFDMMELKEHHPQNFVQAITAAEKEGYDVLIIDSISHAYSGKNGLMELVDTEKLKLKANSFGAWGKVGHYQNELVNKILTSSLNIIVTLRVKTAYDLVDDEKGKKRPIKIGLEPIQKAGFEYEFDILAELTPDNTLLIGKTRCPELNGYVKQYPGQETAEIIKHWLNDGVAPVPAAEPKKEETQAPKKETSATPTKKESKKIEFDTKPAVAEPEPEEEPAPVQNKPTQDIREIRSGIYEGVGVLEKIAEKKEDSGIVYGYIIKGQPVGFRHFSAKAAEENKQLLGKNVAFKVLAGPNGYSLYSIKGA